MEYVIYVDVIFLTDFFLDFLALVLTAAFMREWPSIVRMLLAAMAGSLWTCALAVFPIFPQRIGLLLTVFGAGSVMNLIVFARKDQGFLKNTLCADIALLVSSAIISGCLSFSREHFYLSEWESLAFLGFMAGAAVIFLREIMKTQKIGTERYTVTLHINGSQREFTGLADSGNRLHVPETGKPVSLISYQDCIGFCDKVSGGFFIPYQAVGTEHGLLFAITFEKMEIRKSGTCIQIENPVVAITKTPLSANGDFNMILPEEYVLNSEHGLFKKYQTQRPKEEIK